MRAPVGDCEWCEVGYGKCPMRIGAPLLGGAPEREGLRLLLRVADLAVVEQQPRGLR